MPPQPRRRWLHTLEIEPVDAHTDSELVHLLADPDTSSWHGFRLASPPCCEWEPGCTRVWIEVYPQDGVDIGLLKKDPGVKRVILHKGCNMQETISLPHIVKRVA